MRPSTLLLTTAAAAVSAQDLASLSEAVASLTADPAYSSLVAQYSTADLTSLYQSAIGYADSALASLSAEAATATGSEGAYLSGLYTSATAALSSADALATSALTLTGTGASATQTGGSGNNNNNDSGSNSDSSGSQSASASASQQTDNGAMATAVPVMMGAVGAGLMAVLL